MQPGPDSRRIPYAFVRRACKTDADKAEAKGMFVTPSMGTEGESFVVEQFGFDRRELTGHDYLRGSELLVGDQIPLAIREEIAKKARAAGLQPEDVAFGWRRDEVV